MHWWFSQKQAEHFGVLLVRLEDGREVQATQCSRTENDGPSWDDTFYLGQGTLIRRLSGPNEITSFIRKKHVHALDLTRYSKIMEDYKIK